MIRQGDTSGHCPGFPPLSAGPSHLWGTFPKTLLPLLSGRVIPQGIALGSLPCLPAPATLGALHHQAISKDNYNANIWKYRKLLPLRKEATAGTVGKGICRQSHTACWLPNKRYEISLRRPEACRFIGSFAPKGDGAI